jgi:hypothetical protein
METLEKGDRIQTKLADGVVRSVVDEKVRSEK